MKKTLLIALAAILISSCVTGRKTGAVTGIENLNRDAYTVMPETKSISRTNKIWFLFFPFGGKSETKREEQCLNRMIKDNHADGVMAQKYVHKKITVPLIVVTYSYKYTILTGKPYALKTDSTSVK